jgi:hypothetical protein
LFSADHGFKEEAEGRLKELVIGTDRGLRVEEKLTPHRDNLGRLSVGLKVGKGRE